MIIQHPLFVFALILVVIFELFYIVLDSKEHFVYFRDFMDAVIILTFIICAYCIYHLIKAKRQTPVRASEPIAEVLAQRKLKQETDKELDRLLASEEYKRYQEQKLKRLKSSGGAEFNEQADDSILKELGQKETEIFCD